MGLRVLLVEDEGIIADILTDLLTNMGHHVCAIADAEDEAVIAAELTQPDLLIADANLAAGSGLAAVDRILAGRYVPHLLMSGDPATLAARASAITIIKPFNERELVRAIGRAVEAAQQEVN